MTEYVSASSLLCEISGDYDYDYEQDEFDFVEEFEQSGRVYDYDEYEEEDEYDAVPKVFNFFSSFCFF